MADALFTLLIVLVLSFLFGEFARLIKLPRILGHISAGLLLSTPQLKTAVFDGNMPVIQFLANLGIILLFYYVGLELNLTVLRRYARPSALLSTLKTLLPLGLGFVTMHYLLDYSLLTSLVIGVIVSTSAQSVTLGLLEEIGQLRSKIGALLISVGVVTDMIELIILSIILAAFELANQSLALILFKILAFITLLAIARIFVIPKTLRIFSSSSTSRFMGALILLLAIAVAAELLGIGALTGAVVAGLLIGQTILRDVELPNWEEHDIARSIHIIGFGFFIPIFFVWVGLNTTFSLESAQQALILLAITGIGIIGSCLLSAKLSRITNREALVLGAGLLSKGDIGFVLSALALELGILTQSLFSAVVIMSLIATIISPLLFNYFFTKLRAKARTE